jgi:hypothetical protein
MTTSGILSNGEGSTSVNICRLDLEVSTSRPTDSLQLLGRARGGDHGGSGAGVVDVFGAVGEDDKFGMASPREPSGVAQSAARTAPHPRAVRAWLARTPSGSSCT